MTTFAVSDHAVVGGAQQPPVASSLAAIEGRGQRTSAIGRTTRSVTSAAHLFSPIVSIAFASIKRRSSMRRDRSASTRNRNQHRFSASQPSTAWSDGENPRLIATVVAPRGLLQVANAIELGVGVEPVEAPASITRGPELVVYESRQALLQCRWLHPHEFSGCPTGALDEHGAVHGSAAEKAPGLGSGCGHTPAGRPGEGGRRSQTRRSPFDEDRLHLGSLNLVALPAIATPRPVLTPRTSKGSRLVP
jgi:hypothetical protein